jgi:beta-barrel assembly-enhancing protease
MLARYGDGRAAVMYEAQCEIGADAVTIHVGAATHVWSYADLARADDGNGRIVLKRKPDTGERLAFEADATDELKAAAPKLFTAHAQGLERPQVVAGVVGAAWSLAAVFLVGIPLAAAPIAEVMPAPYRAQIADISWSQVSQLTEYCDDSDEAARILNDMAHRMMTASDVAHRDEIWITIVDANFPNAFALPDDSIIVTDELIQIARHPDELTGVLAHEIAHVERNHVMKNVIRQMGAGIFFDIVFGGAGAGQAIAVASVNLAGLRYTRGDEEDADARGLDYLDAAGIDSGGLASMFDRIQEQEEGLAGIPTMLSTHPATPARAAAARARARQGLQPSLNDRDWRIVRQACGGSAELLPEDEDEDQENGGATGED